MRRFAASLCLRSRRARPQAPAVTIPLRRSLLLMTAATLLPIFVAACVGAVLLVRHERDVAQRSAQERVRALLGAVDLQLAADAAALQSLARSLVEGGFGADAAARRDRLLAEVLAERPHWIRIDAVPLTPGAPSPPSGPADRPVRGADGDAPALPPRAGVSPVGPRPTQGRPGYVVEVALASSPPGAALAGLRAVVSPEPLRRLLAAQDMPPEGAATVLDARQHIVARSRQHEQLLGQPATPGARTLIAERGRGHVRGRTVDGRAVDTFFDTSPLTGWSVAVGMPAATVDASAWSVLGGASALLVFGLAGAFVAAHVGGRRIARPLSALAARARRLGRTAGPGAAGTLSESEPWPVVHTRLTELVDLARDIEQAEVALRQAEVERQAALAREQALRGAAEAESRSKDRLLATLAHELLNPLGAIRLSAQVLRHQQAATGDGPTAPALEALDRQLRHLGRLVDDLLDAARIREGKIALQRQPLRLDRLVEDTLAALRERTRSHDVRVELSPVELVGDETRLAQVVFNLLGNAARHTPPGGRIVVTLQRMPAWAVLEVQDDGDGIAEDLMPRLFELYAQGRDGQGGGLGIGLALVRSLVELHGGTVQARSDGPGRGARFTVRLPVGDPAPPPA